MGTAHRLEAGRQGRQGQQGRGETGGPRGRCVCRRGGWGPAVDGNTAGKPGNVGTVGVGSDLTPPGTGCLRRTECPKAAIVRGLTLEDGDAAERGC